ncbi:hypothetical protein GCM10009633_05380 [Janibacter melonis]|uniref:hypothetical protein n=1 Tax=Janibacter melonis TaxID=262209 RepID=UPI001E43B791|nr:hypothetical protein [Janibacter melonis]MCB5990845.1 hypothetical protein [Janibacter melonis]
MSRRTTTGAHQRHIAPWLVLSWLVAVLCTLLIFLGVGVSSYLISIVAWIASITAVSLRLRSKPAPGKRNATAVWLSPLIAWGLLVLVPWSINLYLDRPWPVGFEGIVEDSLPATFVLNLTALAGLTLGLLCMSAPLAAPEQLGERPRQWRVAVVGSAFVVMYFGSLVATSNSITAFWRLGSDSGYLQTTSARGAVGYFDLIPTAMVVLVLCLAFLEKRSGNKISLTTGTLMAITIVISFGLGSRFRLGLLLFGLIAILWGNAGIRTLGRRLRLMIIAAGSAVGFVAVSGFLSFFRSGVNSSGPDDIIDRFARGVDVLGMQELAVRRGMEAGSLGGESYWEIPIQALPRALTGADKMAPVAQRELGFYLDDRAGFSAPAWFEPWLNFGPLGPLVWGFAFVVGYWLMLRMVATSRRAASLCLFAPLWTLVIYQIFSRLLVTLALSTILASLVALLLARWTMQPVDTTGSASSEIPAQAARESSRTVA